MGAHWLDGSSGVRGYSRDPDIGHFWATPGEIMPGATQGIGLSGLGEHLL